MFTFLHFDAHFDVCLPLHGCFTVVFLSFYGRIFEFLQLCFQGSAAVPMHFYSRILKFLRLCSRDSVAVLSIFCGRVIEILQPF